MKSASLTALAIRFALLYFALAGACQATPAQSEIHFRLVHGTLIVASVTVGLEGAFDFVFDTGADTTIVDTSIASTLSLVPPGRVQQTTLAGAQSLARSSLPALAVGTAHVENLPVLIEDLSELRKMDSHIQGILGQDFLWRFNYLLDYCHLTLSIEPAGETELGIEGDPVPLEAAHHRMIVASQAQAPNSASLRLLLDSGANSIVLVGKASRFLGVPVQRSGFESTSSGQVALKVGRLHVLTVGSQRFRDLPVALASATSAGQIGDGLLPMSLFHSVYVNNRESFVVFNPRPKKN